jgi:hypothetical protein
MPAADLITRLRRLQPQLLALADTVESLAREIGAVMDMVVDATICPNCARRRAVRTQAMRKYRAAKRDIAA